MESAFSDSADGPDDFPCLCNCSPETSSVAFCACSEEVRSAPCSVCWAVVYWSSALLAET